MLSPPPPTTEVVVFSPISPRVGGGWFYTTSPSIGVVGFFPPASAWGGGFCFACPSLGRWSAVVPDQASTSPAPVWGPVSFFFRQPQHGVVVFALPAPAWGGAVLLCQTRQTVHQPQYGGRLVFFSQPQLGEVERCCVRQGKQLSEWLVCAALAARWQPLGKEWSTPPIFATHPGVKPLGGVAPGWQAEVGGQAASFPR